MEHAPLFLKTKWLSMCDVINIRPAVFTSQDLFLVKHEESVVLLNTSHDAIATHPGFFFFFMFGFLRAYLYSQLIRRFML